MKKSLALILAMAMLFALTACGGGTSASKETTPTDAPTDTSADTADTPTDAPADDASDSPAEDVRHKIGVVLYGIDDDMAKTTYTYINHAAELYNCDVVWAIGDLDTAGQLTSCENLIASGVEGLLYMPYDDSLNDSVNKLCQENGVYFATMFRSINDEEIKTECEANPYYVANVHENDEEVGYFLTQCLADAGCKKITANQMSAVSGFAYDRSMGSIKCAEDNGMEIVGSITNSGTGDSQEIINSMTNVLSLYPDCQGYFMISGSLGVGTTVINTLSGLGEKGFFKVAGFDTYSGMKQDFEDGWLVGMAGGCGPDGLFSFICLYNAVDGTPLSDDTIWLIQKMVTVTNAEDCDVYEAYVDNADHLLYDDDTLKSLVGKYNPDVSLEDVEALMDQYSIEWIKSTVE